MELAYQATQEHMETALQKLDEYESVGMGFDKLVAEYALILHDIEEKTWALNQLLKDTIK